MMLHNVRKERKSQDICFVLDIIYKQELRFSLMHGGTHSFY